MISNSYCFMSPCCSLINICADVWNTIHLTHLSDIEEIKKTPKQDKAEEKRVEFHLHSSMSQMDGIPNISAYVNLSF
jgi:DNA polymerase III alpha subunit (gram-positive type)